MTTKDPSKKPSKKLQLKKKRITISEEEYKSLLAEAKMGQEHLDRLKRLAAEFENFKKRMAKEKEELSGFVTANLLRDLLPVLDNFERALSSNAEEIKDPKTILDGEEIIYKSLLNVLEAKGLKAFSSLGETFDPAKHDALLQVETQEHPEGVVLGELEKGYFFKDRMLRHAKVSLSKAKTKEADSSQ